MEVAWANAEVSDGRRQAAKDVPAVAGERIKQANEPTEVADERLEVAWGPGLA